MLNVKDRSSHRSTLISNNILGISRVHIKRYSRGNFLNSLPQSTIQNVNWLQFLSNDQICEMQMPENIRQNEIKLEKLICDEDVNDIKTFEQDQAKNDFEEKINNDSISVNYESMPLYKVVENKEIKKDINFSRKPLKLRYLILKSVCFKEISYNEISFIDMFIFRKTPFTERLRLYFGREIVELKGFGRNFESAIFPFPNLNDVYLVFIIYKLTSSLKDSETKHIPTKLGFFKIYQNDEEIKDNLLKVNWRLYDPELTIIDHIKDGRECLLNINFLAQFSLNPPYQENIVRMTSKNIFHPSPLLTISNIHLSLKRKIAVLKKNYSLCLRISLKTINEFGRVIEKIPSFCNLDSNELTDFCTTSYMPFHEHIFFPDVLNYMLSTQYKEQISIVFELIFFKDDKIKQNKTLIAIFPISKYCGTEKIKMESKGLRRSKIDCYIDFNYIFPFIICPPKTIRKSFEKIIEPVSDQSDPMYLAFVPYLLMCRLESIDNIELKTLLSIFPMDNLSIVDNWIQYYFSCKKGFAKIFIKKLTDSLNSIAKLPFQFFLILFKAMCIENYIDEEEVNLLLNRCANFIAQSSDEKETENIKESTAKFIMCIQYFFNPYIIFRISYKYIFELSYINRIYIYNYIFKDISFINSIVITSRRVFPKDKNGKDIALSLYVPLFSLYFKTITNIFMVNEKNSLDKAITSLSTLSTTLEKFTTPETSTAIVDVISPLLSIIFTFYDSFSAQIDNYYLITPLLLYILRGYDKSQFIAYYNILSNDTQLKFLDILGTLSSPKMISLVSKYFFQDIDEEKENIFNIGCTKEITLRILIFIRFYEQEPIIDSQSLQNIFKLFIKMLSSPKQVSESIYAIFKTICFFIQKYQSYVLANNSVLISQLINAIVPLTQRKLQSTRNNAIGFLLWLSKKDDIRCKYALQYAICDYIFSNNNFISFFDYLPKSKKEVRETYEQLQKALNEPLIDTQIFYLLKLSHNEFKDFPSIRARIYKKLVDLNYQIGDMYSAFVAQIRLCTFISNVLKIKGVISDDISGIFSLSLFVHAEPSINLPKNDFSYILIESDLFSENSLSENLQRTIELCQKANLHWVIYECTEYLFDFLEKQRRYELLQNLYKKVCNSYEVLSENKEINIGFIRIFASGKAAKYFQFPNFIKCIEKDKIEDYIENFRSNSIKISNSEEPILESNENIVQIIKLTCDIRYLERLSVNTFYSEVIKNSNSGWDDEYITKYVFSIDTPLPSILSVSPIKNTEIIHLTRINYYIVKLNSFYDSFLEQIQSIQSILPPPNKNNKRTQWGQCLLNIDPVPLINFFKEISNSKENEFLHILIEFNDKEKAKKIPKQVKDKIKDIWRLIYECDKLIQVLWNNKISKPSPKLYEDMKKYRFKIGLKLN